MKLPRGASARCRSIAADDRDYATDVDALLAAVTDRTRVVYLANPNNPTGTLATRDEVARLYAGLPKDVLLVIDQAYAEYLSPQEDDGGLELAEEPAQCLRHAHLFEDLRARRRTHRLGLCGRGCDLGAAPHPPAVQRHPRGSSGGGRRARRR